MYPCPPLSFFSFSVHAWKRLGAAVLAETSLAAIGPSCLPLFFVYALLAKHAARPEATSACAVEQQCRGGARRILLGCLGTLEHSRAVSLLFFCVAAAAVVVLWLRFRQRRKWASLAD